MTKVGSQQSHLHRECLYRGEEDRDAIDQANSGRPKDLGDVVQSICYERAHESTACSAVANQLAERGLMQSCRLLFHVDEDRFVELNKRTIDRRHLEPDVVV